MSISVDSNGSEINNEDLFSDKDNHSSHERSDEDIGDDEKSHGEDRFAKTDTLYVHLMYKGTRISWKTALNDVNNFCKVVSISYSVGYTWCIHFVKLIEKRLTG